MEDDSSDTAGCRSTGEDRPRRAPVGRGILNPLGKFFPINRIGQ